MMKKVCTSCSTAWLLFDCQWYSNDDDVHYNIQNSNKTEKRKSMVTKFFNIFFSY